MSTNFLIDTNAWEIKQYQLENLSTTNLYRFEVGIIPLNPPFDTDSFCFYMDDINLNAYSGAIPCESYCDGFTRYEAELLENNVCEFSVVEASLKCILPDLVDALQSCSNFCVCDVDNDEYLTYYEGDNSTGECIYSDYENSDYCSEFCGSQELKQPSDWVTDALEERGIVLPDWANRFFTPIMIIFYVILVLMTVLTVVTKSWQFGLITGVLLLIALGTVFIELLFIVIIFIIIAGLLFAKFMTSQHQR